MMNGLKRTIIGMVSIALLSFVTMGCNTIKGLGKDMEKAGKAIEKKAERVEKKLEK